MRKIRWSTFAIVVLTAALLLAAGVSAQSGISVTPGQLTVSGTRGAVETRTLLVRAGEAVSGLRAVSLDLARADGTAVCPASAVRAEVPATAIAAGSVLTVPVTFDLRGVPSGTFEGELLLIHDGGTLSVPLSVNVRDPWPLPLLVLFGGVVLGTGVSAYRARGRLRDEVLVRVGHLRTQTRGDAELAEPFRERVEVHLMDAEAALQAEKWPEAQAAVERAEVAWLRWRKGRSDWLAQLAYRDELQQRLDVWGDVAYVQAVRRRLEDVLRDAPDEEGPDKLRERLEALAEQINRYAQLQSRLDDLNDLRNRSHSADEGWRLRARDLQRQLGQLAPSDEAAYRSLQDRVEAAITELAQDATRDGGLEMATKGGSREAEASALSLVMPAPSAHALAEEQPASRAQVRLRAFTWVTYAVALVFLAGVGFAELYVARSNFGASVWSDYFALLAWGFGAEATRSAVTGMMRSWGLPGAD